MVHLTTKQRWSLTVTFHSYSLNKQAAKSSNTKLSKNNAHSRLLLITGKVSIHLRSNKGWHVERVIVCIFVLHFYDHFYVVTYRKLCFSIVTSSLNELTVNPEKEPHLHLKLDEGIHCHCTKQELFLFKWRMLIILCHSKQWNNERRVFVRWLVRMLEHLNSWAYMDNVTRKTNCLGSLRIHSCC